MSASSERTCVAAKSRERLGGRERKGPGEVAKAANKGGSTTIVLKGADPDGGEARRGARTGTEDDAETGDAERGEGEES